jgi:hypothetical protein
VIQTKEDIVKTQYMQSAFIIIFLLLFPVLGKTQAIGSGQDRTIPDSLRQILSSANNDSIRYQACRLLYTYYEERNRDSALYYADRRLILSRKNGRKIPEAFDLGIKGYQLIYLGRFGEALTLPRAPYSRKIQE